jgi:hypothetical protein
VHGAEERTGQETCDHARASTRMSMEPQMCRNIQQLRGAEPPATDAEIRDAALQYVRKVSGFRSPSRANQEVFDRVVDAVAAATRSLLDDLVVPSSAKPVVPLQRQRAAGR